LGIAKEGSDVDKEVFEQRYQLLGMGDQVCDIILQRLDPVQRHTRADTALQRVGVVVTEVDRQLAVDEPQDLAERGSIGGSIEMTRPIRRYMGMPRDPHQLLRDCFRGQYEVGASRQDRATWHAVILRGVVLGERDSALRLDLFEAEGAIVGSTGQDHSYRPV